MKQPTVFVRILDPSRARHFAQGVFGQDKVHHRLIRKLQMGAGEHHLGHKRVPLVGDAKLKDGAVD